MSMVINGLGVEVQDGWTILDSTRFLGIDIPTLCYHDGLSSWGGCRLCIVEVAKGGKTKIVTACSYPAEDGLNVRTHTEKIVKMRKILVELLLASCPSSKTIQDLASKLGVQQVRFKVRNDDCIYCGLCVRMCTEQMDARALNFIDRGVDVKISTPFNRISEDCRRCGACMYICPACQLRCEGPDSSQIICGRCQTLQPTCIESNPDYMCFMGPAEECGTCIRDDIESMKKGIQRGGDK